jgi:hypothetical protein
VNGDEVNEIVANDQHRVRVNLNDGSCDVDHIPCVLVVRAYILLRRPVDGVDADDGVQRDAGDIHRDTYHVHGNRLYHDNDRVGRIHMVLLEKKLELEA